MSDKVTVIVGAGGFIGGHLISRLLANGHQHIRAVDIKPFDQWFQLFDTVENLHLDLHTLEACLQATREAGVVYNLAADMGGMGFIENNKALCMLSVLINTHLLMAAKEAGVDQFFYASSACVYNINKQKSEQVLPLKEEDAYPAMPEDGYGCIGGMGAWKLSLTSGKLDDPHQHDPPRHAPSRQAPPPPGASKLPGGRPPLRD